MTILGQNAIRQLLMMLTAILAYPKIYIWEARSIPREQALLLPTPLNQEQLFLQMEAVKLLQALREEG